MNKEKLEELVNEVKAGNKEAFSELIKYVEHDLYNIAKSRLSNLHDAQDAIQNTLTAAFTNIDKLEDPKLFKPWIIKILKNACYKFYEKHKRNKEVFDDFSDIPERSDYMESDINFDDMIKDLPEDEQELLKLKYKYDLTFKTIARELNINEGTVKSRIYRSLGKLKKKYSLPTICMFILCFLVATTVLAVSIISYIQSLFSTSNVGIENPGVLMAIEHKDWFQEVDMDYIDLGDGYKIKVEYLLMDEMSLYLVFDFVSENKDISEYTDIIFPDLKITDENNNLICDESNLDTKQYCKRLWTKPIESTSSSIKELVFLYTDSFPTSNVLNIEFSKIILDSLTAPNQLPISTESALTINLLDKFINRNYTTYTSNNKIIEKAIVTETGFYAIIDTDIEVANLKVKISDENGKTYNCYPINFTYDNTSGKLLKLVTCSLNDFDNKRLKLTVQNKKYELIE